MVHNLMEHHVKVSDNESNFLLTFRELFSGSLQVHYEHGIPLRLLALKRFSQEKRMALNILDQENSHGRYRATLVVADLGWT